MIEYLKNCLECGNEFVSENKKSLYCSKYCKNKHIRINTGSIVIIVCDYCGKNFESNNRSNRFCSSECKQKYYIENPIKHEYNLICSYCGKNFIKLLSNKPKENDNHYCSQECVGKNKNKVGINSFYYCKYCGKEFKQMHKRNFYCSNGCKNLYAKQNPVLGITNCSYCGKEIQRLKCDIKTQDNFFCSRNCESNFTSDKAKDIRICRYCGKEFQCKKSDLLVFCSKACQITGMNKGPTTPHLKIMNLLDVMNIFYEIEKPVKRYSIDIYLPYFDLYIEIMGGYFHCDRRIYDGPTNDTQYDGIKKDRKKQNYFLKNEINILYLWEYDISKNIELCENLILKFIENCGILDNYHSMNYEIQNDLTKLNSNILIPYFEIQ